MTGTYERAGVVYRAGRRVWTAADDAELRRLYPDVPNVTIAQTLRRTIQAIYGRADKLRLRKSAAYLASSYACRLRRGDHVGAPFRFPKGHVPANKGLRRPSWHRGRMRDTQFRPGVPSWRTMPVGATRLTKDGYVLRKVSAIPHVGQNVNWKLEQRLVWQRAHGPVPRGHALQFKNGDRTDCRLENLELVPRRALMARNTVHNLPKPLASTIQLLGQLKRRIRERTDRGEEQNSRPA